jgi:hypothetical protein
VVAVWLTLFGFWAPTSAPSGRAQSSENFRVLAVIGRQVGLLNFEAPRPRILTSLAPPSFAMDVASAPSTTTAVLSVAEPFQGQGDVGGDLLGLDLEAPEHPISMFVARADPTEWLGAPAWLPDGSGLLYQREDVQAGSDLYAGQSGVRYPSRIEIVSSPGAARRVLTGYGHQPSPSPDGGELAYVRLSPGGSMLIAHAMDSDEERTLVPAGSLPDIAYPRYSPGGDRVAFVATSASAHEKLATTWFGPRVALAHGAPWNLWVVNRDGSGLRQLAAVGADDASLAWSPDASQLFVYGSTGARLVTATSGETELLSHLTGFGAISWLP